jgi:hypothetical protein
MEPQEGNAEGQSCAGLTPQCSRPFRGPSPLLSPLLVRQASNPLDIGSGRQHPGSCVTCPQFHCWGKLSCEWIHCESAKRWVCNGALLQVLPKENMAKWVQKPRCLPSWLLVSSAHHPHPWPTGPLLWARVLKQPHPASSTE